LKKIMTNPLDKRTGEIVFANIYSRIINGRKENWQDLTDRMEAYLQDNGGISQDELKVIVQERIKTLKVNCSGRAMWVGGTPWSRQSKGIYGLNNCYAFTMHTEQTFALAMELLMCGGGVGVNYEQEYVSQLPPICQKIKGRIIGEIGAKEKCDRVTKTTSVHDYSSSQLTITVGDSREGWCEALNCIIGAFSDRFRRIRIIALDFGSVRPAGEAIKGFGGISSPQLLSTNFLRIIDLLNNNRGYYTDILCEKIMGLIAEIVVAGGIRRSARLSLYSPSTGFEQLKNNLYVQDKSGNWSIDKNRSMCVNANHTAMYRELPTLDTLKQSVAAQWRSGEGAIADWSEISRRVGTKNGTKYTANPCFEIIGNDGLACNLANVQLSRHDHHDPTDSEASCYVAGKVAASLLMRKFPTVRLQLSREQDPIVGVSLTGMIDFFVMAGGRAYIEWWLADRPHKLDDGFLAMETMWLKRWKKAAVAGVTDFCSDNKLTMPTRCTTIQPAGCWDVTAVRVTDDGIIMMDEHAHTDGWNNVSISVRKHQVTKAIKNKPSKLIQITLANGKILKVTKDHRLCVKGQNVNHKDFWVKAEDLTVKQMLSHKFGVYDRKEEAELLNQIGKTPEKMSPKLAYLIGIIFGNGCFSNNSRIRISHSNVKILACVDDIFFDLFGIRGSYHQSTNRAAVELCFRSTPVYQWFIDNGIAKTTKSLFLDRSPIAVRHSSKDSILGFIAGLIDTDGCVRKGGQTSIDMASEGFIRHIQQLMESVGLVSGVSHNIKGAKWSTAISLESSDEYALSFLNENCLKAKASGRPIAKNDGRHFNRYYIIKIEETDFPEASYDLSMNTGDDNDDWYYQGAIRSHNTASLLTGGSPGIHWPKATRYIRRMTMPAGSPIAIAAQSRGMIIIPSAKDKDADGKLLTDINDPLCTEWMVEVPVEVPWAHMAEGLDLSKIPATAQLDFSLLLMNHYADHTVSQTLELWEHEIEPLAIKIYEAMKNQLGYVSTAILPRFDAASSPFPRLPFEPCSKEEHDRRVALLVDSDRPFTDLLVDGQGSGCDSQGCEIKQ
jgi:ribonucleotide reductase class II